MAIKVIAFDADDTLWVNEPYFQETEKKFCALLEDYMPHHAVAKELYQTEINNLQYYGYGIKGFMLSMIETALRISDKNVSNGIIEKALEYGKELLAKPIELLDGIENVLKELQPNFRLVVATKGDLLDQERKLKKSGIEHYFHHIEIMSDKKESDYQKLIKHLDILPNEFLMVGNSLKSDIMPVLAIGAHAIHIPFHTTWAHEIVEEKIAHKNFRQVLIVSEILTLIKTNIE